MAFSIEGYLDDERKADSRYVKYIVRMLGKKDGVFYEDVLPYHECSDADWAEFAPAAKASLDPFNSITTNPKRGMYCIDWSPDRLVYGKELDDNY